MDVRLRSGPAVLAALMVLGTASPALAQTFGVGGGVSQDPDQIFIQGLVDQRGLGTTRVGGEDAAGLRLTAGILLRR